VFTTVLVANRGEIAVRVVRTLRRLGIRSAVVYSDADAGARHVAEADVAVRVGPAAPAASYLDIDGVIAAARQVGAQAVHPGYGFLSENAAFARACADAGLVFVGPPAAAIETMGDKIAAKRTVEAAGVPVVPGVHRPGLSDDDLVEAAHAIGFPVLVKPAAGGGGKGMHRVDDAAELPAALATARREARGAFGDDTLFLERYVTDPRHIEIQVLADTFGAVVHLGERECSLQRRHQKVVEEAPSPLLDQTARERMGAAAVRTAAACGYVGAGTVEMIVSGDKPEDFFFLEMNTRLQVEHPVTELVTGLDLVEEQLRIAAGAPLRMTQDQVVLTGHAIEARVYAEDPAHEFLPTGGRVLLAAEPADVRVDSGITTGSDVGSVYDPMLAKVAALAPTREEAVDRLDRALASTVVLGVPTNVAFLRALLADPDVRAGRLDTGLIERRVADLVRPSVPDEEAALAAALGDIAVAGAATAADGSVFGRLVGWRVGGPAWVRHLLAVGDHTVEVHVRGGADGATVRLASGEEAAAAAVLDGAHLHVTVDGVTRTWAYARDERGTWVGLDGATWLVRERPVGRASDDAAAAGVGPLVSPLPGTVTAVHVSRGEAVSAGQPVVTVEAMKMEHVVRAPAPGVVVELDATVGQVVPLEAVLARLAPVESEAPQVEGVGS
jgi:acetyl-CoA/propionyl-CoA carboxylase, biotin carboxylase, biotin carboxyl carrier protein